MNLRLSHAEIEAAKSSKGGWTRATLAKWGVPWPPPKGWRRKMSKPVEDEPADMVSIAAEPPAATSDEDLIRSAKRKPITIADLMRKDVIPMRAAAVRLFSLEREGRLVREGGGAGEAYRWAASAPKGRAGA